jgi:hypothetical protein
MRILAADMQVWDSASMHKIDTMVVTASGCSRRAVRGAALLAAEMSMITLCVLTAIFVVGFARSAK